MPAKKTTVKKATTTGLSMPLFDISGKEKETIDLPKEIFNVKASPKLLAQYVRVYLASQRQGTASTKTRGEVSGSTKKIYRQKGTGRARHGSSKAPIFVGGGVVGGPKPTNHALKINKKQKQKALFSALTMKRKDIIGLAESKAGIKTKNMAGFLKNLKLEGVRILLVMPKMEKNNLLLAARNIPRIQLTDAMSINAYEVLRTNKIIMLDTALTVLEKHFLKHEN